MFTTKECAYAQVSVKMLGRTIAGLRGFEAKISIEKEHLYGAGSKPIDIQTGNEKCEGNLKLLKFEVDLFNDAAQAAGYRNLLDVPHTGILISIAYKKTATSAMRVMEVAGVAFTEIPNTMEQNAKQTEITLPYLAMSITDRMA